MFDTLTKDSLILDAASLVTIVPPTEQLSERWGRTRVNWEWVTYFLCRFPARMTRSWRRQESKGRWLRSLPPFNSTMRSCDDARGGERRKERRGWA